MKDKQDGSMDREKSWFADPGVLLKELKRTSEHWAELPRIEGYDRMVELCRGGQGVIYRARQRSTNRTVAVKVLLDGVFASDESRARFQREIELVSGLRHPNLVQIHDSGLTPDRCLFYIMEFVEGVPLNHKELTAAHDLEATLRLFVKICKAVRHAHQHGIIHRDLKPNNILVDRQGEPRILDFGLAKIIDDPQGNPSVRYALVSRTGQFFGSLAWAAPEQIERSANRIDTRTDLYSLGVILYQLLTGKLPHTPTQNLHHTIKAIVTESPKRPSNVNPSLPDDVETIVLRCLSKEPDRRYQSAGDLLRDIERYLGNEPIEAKRDRPWYVLRKTMSRHKTISALIIVVFMLVIGFAGVMAMLYPRAVRAEMEARDHLQQAEIETAKARAVRDFLSEMLSHSDPFVSKGKDLTVRQLLDASARKIDEQFQDHPQVEAEIRAVLGSAYYHLGHLEEAEKHDRIAHDLLSHMADVDPLKIVSVVQHLGLIDLDNHRFDEAEDRFAQARKIYEEQVGHDHPLYADCLQSLAGLRQAQFRWDEAGTLYEEANAIYKQFLDTDDNRYLANIIQWSGLLISLRQLDKAIARLNEAVKVIEQDPEEHAALRSAVLFFLGLALFNSQRFDEAESIAREALENHEQIFGEQHTRTAEIYTLLGNIRRTRGKYDEAEDKYLKAYTLYEELTGRESVECASSLWNLADTLWRRGDRPAAEARFQEALRIRKKVYGPEHHLISASISRIGLLFSDAGLWEKAKPYFEEAVAIQKMNLGEAHPRTARAQALLGECLFKAGQLEQGEQLLLESLKIVNKSPTPSDAYLRHIYQSLIALYEVWEKPGQAAAYEALLEKTSASPSEMLIK